jgi:hypothetical protein
MTFPLCANCDGEKDESYTLAPHVPLAHEPGDGVCINIR